MNQIIITNKFKSHQEEERIKKTQKIIINQIIKKLKTCKEEDVEIKKFKF